MKLNFFTQTSGRVWLVSALLMLGFVSTAVAQIPGAVKIRAEKQNATECDAKDGQLWISATGLPTLQPPGLPVGKILFQLTVTRQATGNTGSQISVPIPVVPTAQMGDLLPLIGGVNPAPGAPDVAGLAACTPATIAGLALPSVGSLPYPLTPGSVHPVVVGQPNYYTDPAATAAAVAAAVAGLPIPAIPDIPIPNPCLLSNTIQVPPGRPMHPFPGANVGAPGSVVQGFKLTGLPPGIYTITAENWYAGVIGAAGGILPLASQTVTVEIGVTPDAVSCIGGSPTSPGLNLTAAPAASVPNGTQNCDTRLRASQLLVNDCSNNNGIVDTAYTVIATTLGGTEIARSDDGVMYIPKEYIGKVFKASVTRHLYSTGFPMVNSTCWGYVKLEDKTAPQIKACPANVTLACASAEWANGVAGSSLTNSLAVVGELSGPSSTSQSTNLVTGVVNSVSPATNGSAASDGTIQECSKWTQFYSDVVTGTKCAGFTVTRTWWAKDEWGNTSVSCNQIITISAPVAPTVTNLNVPVSCTVVTEAVETAILAGGGPNNLKPVVDGATSCGFELVYKSSMKLNGQCAGSFRIMREYVLVNTCNGVSTPYTQVITVSNDAAPTVSANYDDYSRANDGTYCWLMNGTMRMESTKYKTAVNNVTTVFNGGTTIVYPLVSSTMCEAANVRIQLTGVDNGCIASGLTFSSNDSRIQISATGLITNKTGQPFMKTMNPITWLPENPKFTVNATTACGITTKHTFEVSLADNMTPNTVCKVFTTATLDENGFVRVPVSAFENGSSDNCNIERQMVRRMTVSGDQACGVNSQVAETACWNDYVDFTCADINDNGGQIVVLLRSVDAAGNSSDCMVNVSVVDKTAPSCTNQPQINRICTDLDLNNYKLLFKRPAAFDNCGVSLRDSSITDLAIRCGAGNSTATWTFIDCAGNTTSCTQRLNVTTVRGFRVTPLSNQTVTCTGAITTAEQDRLAIVASAKLLHTGAGAGAGSQPTSGAGVYATCSAPVVDVTESIYSNTEFCKVIVRTYVIKDICQLSTAPSNITAIDEFVPVANGDYQSFVKDGGHYIRYTRTITVNDRTAPTSTVPTAPAACVYDACTFNYAVTLTGSDNCGTSVSGSSLVFSWRAINKATGAEVATGNSAAVSLAGLAFGKYTICYRVADLCGNMSTEYCYDIEGKDCKAPQVLVHNKIVELAGGTGVRSSGMAEMLYIDIRNNIFDNCDGDLTDDSKVTLEKGGVTAATAPTATQGTQVIRFTCDDLFPAGGAAVRSRDVSIRVWAKDKAGNWNYAISTITLQDNIGICPAGSTISGGARTEANSVVNSVAVSASVNGAVVSTTNAANGAFVLSVAPSANVQVRATKTNNEDAAAGVTTFDIAKVSQHVLAIEQLATPYKMIAADVDKSGEIDATDMVHMRRFILKITPSLPGGNFRFLDKAYAFRNAANPFGEDFPEVVNFSSLTSNAVANFVAVKLGDVNDSYNGAAFRSAKTLNFLANDMSVVSGNEYTVNISADKMDAAAFQGTFSFNGATVKSVKAGDLANMTEGNFGIFANAVTTSWNGKTQASADVLAITFVANKSGKLSEMLTINSALTQAVANDVAGNEMNVNLKFNTGKVAGGEFALYQNQPNPVAGQTTIGFNLPKDGAARLSITGVDGKVVKVINGDYKAGFNSLTINKSDLNASGVFYYKLETADYSAVKKMVIVE